MKTSIALACVAMMAAIAPSQAASGLGASAVSASASGASSVSVGGAAYNANIFAGSGHTKSSTRLRAAPNAIAPGLAASAVETCMGSSSAGGSGMGWGFSIGTTYSDNGCEARLDARTLFAMGQKTAALLRLCDRPELATVFLAAGTPCPADRARLIAARQQQVAAAHAEHSLRAYAPQAPAAVTTYDQPTGIFTLFVR